MITNRRLNINWWENEQPKNVFTIKTTHIGTIWRKAAFIIECSFYFSTKVQMETYSIDESESSLDVFIPTLKVSVSKSQSLIPRIL